MQLRIAGKYIENKDFKNGIASLEKTIEYAEEYMDDASLEKAEGSLSRAYMQYGTNINEEKTIRCSYSSVWIKL